MTFTKLTILTVGIFALLALQSLYSSGRVMDRAEHIEEQLRLVEDNLDYTIDRVKRLRRGEFDPASSALPDAQIGDSEITLAKVQAEVDASEKMLLSAKYKLETLVDTNPGVRAELEKINAQLAEMAGIKVDDE